MIRRCIHTPASHSDPIGPVETEGKKAAIGSGKRKRERITLSVNPLLQDSSLGVDV